MLIKEEFMKTKSVFLFVLVFSLIFISGCATALPYSFAENESETASITFFTRDRKEGVDLHYFEGIELPIPETMKYWAPVIFPAGRPFTLTVNTYDSILEKGTERFFNCPALTAGTNYKLEYKRAKIFGILGNRLILSDAKTKKIIFEQQL
jgi:hypothetical protein